MYLAADFDGFITTMDNFVDNYKERVFSAVEKMTGAGRSQLEQEYHQSGLVLEQNPTKLGWVHHDPSGIASFWNEGPQFRATTTFEHMLTKYTDVIKEKFHEDHVIEKPKKDLNYNVLEFHFLKAYVSTPQQVDHDKLQALYDGLKELETGFSIASTSREGSIRKKIGDLDVEVSGEIRKFEFDKSFTPYGKVMNVSHGTHVYPVRNVMSRAYHDALEGIAARNGSVDIVGGDIFSLDLALPLAMGKHVILKRNHYAPEWALNHVHNHERGHIVDEITEIPRLIKKLMG